MGAGLLIVCRFETHCVLVDSCGSSFRCGER